MSSNKKTAKKEIKKVEEKSKFPLVISLLVILGIGAFATWYFLSNSNEKETSKGNTTSTKTGNSETIAPGNPKTPTDAYKKLYAAVKSQNKSAIRSLMSKDSMGLAQMQAGQSKKEVDEVLRNAFTATTYAKKLPAIRDERIKGRYGAIEVFNEKHRKWENLPFIIENGAWKLAVGNLFAGNFQSPGKPRTTIEKENANAAGKRDMVPYSNSNINTANIKPKVIDTNKAERLPGPPNKVPPPKNKK